MYINTLLHLSRTVLLSVCQWKHTHTHTRVNNYILLYYPSHLDFLLLVSHSSCIWAFALGMDAVRSWHALAGMSHPVHTYCLSLRPPLSFSSVLSACSWHAQAEASLLICLGSMIVCACTCAALLCTCVHLCVDFSLCYCVRYLRH